MTSNGEELFLCGVCHKNFHSKIHLTSHMRTHNGEKRFECDYCSKKFKIKEGLDKHILAHTGNYPLSCNMCGKGVYNKSYLELHMKSHTGDKPFACHICGKNFITKSRLKLHIRYHTDERPFVCNLCGKKFTSEGNLNVHMKWHKSARSFSCSICSKNFITKATLKAHARRHTPRQLREECFSCDSCSKSYFRKDLLEQHARVHTGDYPLSCAVCGKGVICKSRLRAHMRCHTGEKPFECDYCSKKFRIKKGLEKHILTHTGDYPSSCNVCGKGFFNNSYLRVHMRSHTGEKPFACHVCVKNFATNSRLKEHMKIHTVKEAVACDICGKNCSSKQKLEAHVRTHSHKTSYSCHVCGQNFFLESLLNAHMSSCHTNTKPYSCDTCGKKFSRRRYLVAHMRIHKREESFPCDLCNKKFARRDILERHIRIHTGDYPLSCAVCGKGVSNECNLKEHMRSHTGEKPFSCSVCGKSYNKKSNLNQHAKTHTGERSFSCDLCSKSYTKNTDLVRHKILHKGEKPFSCGLCGKSYTRKAGLKQHVETHTGEKSFLCDFCNKSFHRKRYLIDHMRSHTRDRSFACKICNTKFRYRKTMNRHMKSMHPDEGPVSCDFYDLKSYDGQQLTSPKIHDLIEENLSSEFCNNRFIDENHSTRQKLQMPEVKMNNLVIADPSKTSDDHHSTSSYSAESNGIISIKDESLVVEFEAVVENLMEIQKLEPKEEESEGLRPFIFVACQSHAAFAESHADHDTGDPLINEPRSEWGEEDFNKVPGCDRDGRKKLSEPLYDVYKADKVKKFKDNASVISISNYSAYGRVHVLCDTLQRISKDTRGVFGQTYSKKNSHKNRDKLFSNESIFLDQGSRDDSQWSKAAFKKKGDMADEGETRSIYWRDIYAPEEEEMPTPDYDCLLPDPVYIGVNRQYKYIGGPGSLTPYHLENGSLESRSELLLGKEKFWMLLPLEEAKKLGRKLHENCGLEPCALFHGPTWIFVHPDLLDKWGIQVTYIVQREGDIIDLHAYVLHAVLSNGLHVARAKNFASPKTATEDEVKLCECETTGRIPRSDFRFKEMPAEYEGLANEQTVRVPVVAVHNNQDTSEPCGNEDIYNIETSEDCKPDTGSRTGSPPSVTIKAASANQDNDRSANQKSFLQHHCKFSDLISGGTFCSESGRQEPVKAKHKAATICCKYARCVKKFSSKQGLCNHDVQVHQKRKRMCSDCRKRISVKNFERHRRIHARDQKVTCDQCKRTMNYDNIVKHLKRCEGTIVCKSCRKVFMSNQGMSSHKCK